VNTFRGPEFTIEEWQRRAPRLQQKRAVHERGCKGACGHVFRCRGSLGGSRAYSCGRYVGACKGGSDDNRCADCWCRKERAAEKRADS
jgi:hypothetical protein